LDIQARKAEPKADMKVPFFGGIISWKGFFVKSLDYLGVSKMFGGLIFTCFFKFVLYRLLGERISILQRVLKKSDS